MVLTNPWQIASRSRLHPDTCRSHHRRDAPWASPYYSRLDSAPRCSAARVAATPRGWRSARAWARNPSCRPPTQVADPDRRHRARAAAGRPARSRRAAPGLAVDAFAQRPRPSALAVRAAQRRRAGRRDQRAAQARRRQGHQGLVHEAGCMKKAGAGDAEREPHHAAARRRRRRRRRDRAACSCTSLNSPFGMALVGNDVLRRQHRRASCGSRTRRRRPRSTARRRKVVDLPAGPLNHHWTKNLIASRDGTQALRRRSARTATSARTAWQTKRAAPRSGRSIARRGATRVFATGLRNPNGMAWEPQSGALWTVVNERDELGSDLVPDYMTSVQRRRLLRLAVQLLRPARRRAREAAAARPGRARRSCPTTRSARTPRRSASRSTTATLLPRALSRAARSSASTARGTASRAAATR